jgi:hypothetical protein
MGEKTTHLDILPSGLGHVHELKDFLGPLCTLTLPLLVAKLALLLALLASGDIKWVLWHGPVLQPGDLVELLRDRQGEGGVHMQFTECTAQTFVSSIQ